MTTQTIFLPGPELTALIAELNELVSDIKVQFVAYGDGRSIVMMEEGSHDVLTPDEAMDFALELAELHDEVLADPISFHVDTLAFHGVEVPADHPALVTLDDLSGCAAAGTSPDCTGEGTAYAGRCLPCDLALAAAEEAHAAEAEIAYGGRYY